MMSNFWHSESVILPTWIERIRTSGLSAQWSRYYVNILQQRNFEEEFEQIMEGSKSQLQEYFRYTASIQQMSPPPFDWENAKIIYRNLWRSREVAFKGYI